MMYAFGVSYSEISCLNENNVIEKRILCTIGSVLYNVIIIIITVRNKR